MRYLKTDETGLIETVLIKLISCCFNLQTHTYTYNLTFKRDTRNGLFETANW